MWNEWSGTLNTGNVKLVADLIRTMLTGHKYTRVESYEYAGYKPRVRMHQELGGSIDGNHVHLHEENSHIVVCDSYGVWGLSTIRTEPGYDSNFDSPHIHLEWDRATITQRTPEGLMCYWVVVVEDPDEDSRSFIRDYLEARRKQSG